MKDLDAKVMERLKGHCDYFLIPIDAPIPKLRDPLVIWEDFSTALVALKGNVVDVESVVTQNVRTIFKNMNRPSFGISIDLPLSRRSLCPNCVVGYITESGLRNAMPQYSSSVFILDGGGAVEVRSRANSLFIPGRKVEVKMYLHIDSKTIQFVINDEAMPPFKISDVDAVPTRLYPIILVSKSVIKENPKIQLLDI